MATKKATPTKRAGKINGKTSKSMAERQQLQKELKELREENRMLKKSLGALLFKDEPVNMDLTPDDGLFEPPLNELIAEIERAG